MWERSKEKPADVCSRSVGCLNRTGTEAGLPVPVVERHFSGVRSRIQSCSWYHIHSRPEPERPPPRSKTPGLIMIEIFTHPVLLSAVTHYYTSNKHNQLLVLWWRFESLRLCSACESMSEQLTGNSTSKLSDGEATVEFAVVTFPEWDKLSDVSHVCVQFGGLLNGELRLVYLNYWWPLSRTGTKAMTPTKPWIPCWLERLEP